MKKSRRRTSRAMYGISRIDDDKHRTHAWRVSLRRQGKTLVRNFADQTHGGKGKALAKAKQYRDELLVKHPPTTRKKFCSILRRNNTSGIPGVCVFEKPYELQDGTVKSLRYWEANWPLNDGQNTKATFSVKTYGEEHARELAIKARKRGLRQLKGVLWSSERGEVKA